MCRTALTGSYATDNYRSIFGGAFGVKRSLFTRNALDNQARVLID
jgi:hypothetical protein